MDIKKIITDAVEKLASDDKLKEKFFKEPVPVLEELLGVDLPDDQINAVIDGIKAKLNLDDVADKAKDVLGALGGLFGKK